MGLDRPSQRHRLAIAPQRPKGRQGVADQARLGLADGRAWPLAPEQRIVSGQVALDDAELRFADEIRRYLVDR